MWPARHPAFTRFNVFLRDKFQCQYCGNTHDLTFDHVIPRSKGGTHDLGERRGGLRAVQPARRPTGCRARSRCSRCRRPIQPTVHDLHNNGRAFPPNHLHQSWLDYLYWDIELEP
jgi:5-methylcytosine-specific restriction endonuclease McrA